MILILIFNFSSIDPPAPTELIQHIHHPFWLLHKSQLCSPRR